jgi:hypothetical protein
MVRLLHPKAHPPPSGRVGTVLYPMGARGQFAGIKPSQRALVGEFPTEQEAF